MKQKTLLLMALLAFVPIISSGQVRTASPSATEFVKYERIPVGYFNGIPNIEIPLYTAKVGELQLPIYLSYHASGIQIEQHPTCVGLGWTLNAGGAITRVVNGRQDECTWFDYNLEQIKHLPTNSDHQPGYLSYSCKMGDAWTTENPRQLYEFGALSEDSEPDEFVINAYGLSASIWFYRDKNGEIKSKIRNNNGVSFTIKPPVVKTVSEELAFPALHAATPLPSQNVNTAIVEFTVIKSDGTELIFGRNDDAIEFYTEPRMSRPDFLTLKTIASTWMLTSIKTPDGHIATFKYNRNGSPIVMSDVRTDIATYDMINHEFVEQPFSWGSYGYRLPNYQDSDRGKSFTICHPVYLQCITVDNDLNIYFDTGRSYDLNSLTPENEHFLSTDGFQRRHGTTIIYGDETDVNLTNNCAPHNYRCKLNTIYIEADGVKFPYYHFYYIENEKERLKLDKIRIQAPVGQIEQTYSFEYDTNKLPPYTSTLSDAWGYYNGKDYRKINIEDDFFGYRSANLMFTQAEVLKSVTYPTGGTARFTYELNDYSQIAIQAPDFMIQQAEGISGGLRIKEIAYTDKDDKTVLKHRFQYVNDEGKSSGILSGVPVYVSEGSQHTELVFTGWGKIHKSPTELDRGFKITSESYINTLGLTSGRHTTYSRVIETIGIDTLLTKEYRYTNHDTVQDTLDYNLYTNIDEIIYLDKFTSRALERGLLTDEIWYGADSRKIKHIHNTYRSDKSKYDEFVKSIQNINIGGLFGRTIPYKILTFYPYLESRITTEYDPSGETVISSTKENWSYNSHLMPIRHTIRDKNGRKITTYTTYADRYGTGIYTQMQKRGMFGLPVEKIVCLNDRLSHGEINEYAVTGDFVKLSKTSRLELDVPADSSSYKRFDGADKDSRYKTYLDVRKYDVYGNPEQMTLRNGDNISYMWNQKAAKPSFEVRNAANTYHETTVTTPVRTNLTINLDADNPSYNRKKYHITTSETEDVTITLQGMLGYDWYVSGTFDGTPFDLTQRRSGLPISGEWELYSQYGHSAIFQYVRPGSHIIDIRATAARKKNAADTYQGSMSVSYYGISSHIEESGSDEYHFNDFEANIGEGIYPFGYHSDRCYVGPYEIHLEGESGKGYILDYYMYFQGKWKYKRQHISGRTCKIDEGINPIDNIRLYPSDAEVFSYTWIPYVGMRSVTDTRGVTTSYDYDYSGRLKYIKDNEGNIVKRFVTHYGESYGEPSPSVYCSEEMGMVFYSNKCDLSLGYVPKPVRFVVPSCCYTSTVSQDEANRMAFTDIIMLGQAYADENGEYEECIIIDVANQTGDAVELELVFGTQGSLEYRHYIIPQMPDDNVPHRLYISKHNYRSVSAKLPDGTIRDVKVESGDLLYYDRYFPGLTDVFVIR